jgi:predicted DNA-binding protein YlxM (UPF0122 family)
MKKDKSEIVHGIIYVHTNMINDKQYIGKTINTIKQRAGKNFKGYSGKNKNGQHNHFYKSILKYGYENFVTDILFEGDISHYVLIDFEKYFIWKYDTFNNGYNETTGGEGGIRSEEMNKKMSEYKLNGKESPTKELLLDLYQSQKLSTRIIGEKLGLSFEHIRKCLYKYRIKVRKNSESLIVPSYETLFELYIINGYSIKDISIKYNVYDSTVRYWIKNVGMQINTITISKDEIYKLYIDDKLSTVQIGKIYNISNCTVGRILKKYNIRARSNSEAQSFNKNTPDKSVLIDLYINKELTLRNISDKLKIGIKRIRTIFREYNIPVRNKVDAQKARKC